MRDEWDWCYRLFFSVDVVGSTAVKAQEGWIQSFEEFLEEFPKVLLSRYETLGRRKYPKVRNLPSVWKFVGDEILLTAELSNHLEALTHVIAFKEALEAASGVDSREVRRKQLPALRLKGTLWTAGFPVENATVRLGDSQHDGQRPIVDYLGPSVDIGFRLAAFADARRIPVSAQLAYMLLDAGRFLEKHDELAFRYDGRRQMKGVFGGEGYPIICVDRRDGRLEPEDKLLGRSWDCVSDDLSKFLSQFFRDNSGRIRRPFIATDENKKYGEVPEDMKKARDRLRRDDPDVAYEETESSQSEAAATPHPDGPSPPELDRKRLNLATSAPKRKRSTRKGSKEPRGKSRG